MKETILEVISELESQVELAQMMGGSAIKMNQTILKLRSLIESSDIVAYEDNRAYETDLTEPAFPRTGDFIVEIVGEDGKGNVEFQDGKWYLAGTNIEVFDEDLKCHYLYTRVTNDFRKFYDDEPTDGYRFYGYKFASLNRYHPEDTYRWYDRLRKVWIEEPLHFYRNTYIKSK